MTPVDGSTKLTSLVDTETLMDRSVSKLSALVKSATFTCKKPCSPSKMEEEFVTTFFTSSTMLDVIDVAVYFTVACKIEELSVWLGSVANQVETSLSTVKFSLLFCPVNLRAKTVRLYPTVSEAPAVNVDAKKSDFDKIVGFATSVEIALVELPTVMESTGRSFSAATLSKVK